MSNKVYDVLKYIALVFLPALEVFIGIILSCFDFQYTEIVLKIMAGFDTFLGSVLMISNSNYKKKNQI